MTPLNREDRSPELDEAVSSAYAQLHELAAFWFARERGNHTLQPTAVVHEVYLRMARQGEIRHEDRARFLALAAEMIRRILIDHARKSTAIKRGGNAKRSAMDPGEIGVAYSAEQLLEIHEAIEALGRVDERRARVVELRFFGGLKHADIGLLLGVSPETVKSDWRFARAWLRSRLEG